MRVKIGNVWYDSKENDICLEFEGNHEKNLIKEMEDDDMRAAFYSTENFSNPDDVIEWMNE